MKYFIVNVNNCLPKARYAPFFYEYIYDGDLVMLDDIENTSQLEKTYHQLVSDLNRNPFQYRKSVVFLFLPRDLTQSVQAEDYELYNDMNIYMHLLRRLGSRCQVYAFYVDRTGELKKHDAAYPHMHQVNKSLQAQSRPELIHHFLELGDISAREGDYKLFLREKIGQLDPVTQAFYLYMLDKMPEMKNGTAAQFCSFVNNYISQSRDALEEVNHIHAPVFWLDIADELEEWIRIIYYVKEIVEKKAEQLPDYEEFAFRDHEDVKRLIATYRARLRNWESFVPPLETKATFTQWQYLEGESTAGKYHRDVEDLVNQCFKNINPDSVKNQEAVDVIFDHLKDLVSNAEQKLRLHAYEKGARLLDDQNYREGAELPFDLEEETPAEKAEEEALLNEMNQHILNAGSISSFTAENRLLQELEVNDHRIQQILMNLQGYSRGFLGAIAFAVLALFALHWSAQYSIFMAENSWLIALIYLVGVTAVFATSYVTVHKKFRKEIRQQIEECKDKVRGFLSDYKEMATKFEKNINKTGAYNCLRRELDVKRAAREVYRLRSKQLEWHKRTVSELLQELSFFDSFVGDTQAEEETELPLIDLAHDPEHTEFYLMKVFRR